MYRAITFVFYFMKPLEAKENVLLYKRISDTLTKQSL